ncbi:MAG: FAD-dependent thymidylate synthase [Candidatus Aenigmarchaeota archaeon]|nr:FAD-dependent thymidylate synthase [Candidatus Aenigmarchaeota archaeon]NIP40556.1 FAD-dependent thymidylate synthase [Candidatus Aenigmarchaeota archaeon]NIQ18401.1 FAD-dependent thymidylate synthase [Candidatus Aenigmarchaeota archaeon]
MFDPTIEIISHTPDLERVCTAAVKHTYRKEKPSELMRSVKDRDRENLLGNIMKAGHLSVIEHGYFTMFFTDVSVFFEQFLIEHRLASYTVKSRRYVDYSESGFVVPNYLEDKPIIRKKYVDTVKKLFGIYGFLVKKGVPVEDARFVLPYCFKTSMICTMNSRELYHFLERCLTNEYEEIRKVGRVLLAKVKRIAPRIYGDLELKTPEKEEQVVSFEKSRSPKKKVELLYFTEKPDEKVVLANLVKNTQMDIETLKERAGEVRERVMNNVLKSRRPRELEQVNFTFRINNLSLSILTHITRHRIHSLIVPDFVIAGKSDNYVVPESVRRTGILEKKYREAFELSQELHNFLVKKDVPKEDLVYNYLSGNLIDVITTMDARELCHFLRLRTCERAQWEVREIANQILKLVMRVAPLTFRKAGPSCYFLGHCPEGKLTCGKFDEVVSRYKDLHEKSEGHLRRYL